MKKIFRMIIFTTIAIYVTSLWNKGFLINMNWQTFAKAVIIVAIIYYFIYPLSKLILLPLNVLTLGAVSAIILALLFYLFIARYDMIKIQPWVFRGTDINYLWNIVLSSLSISVIINFLEKLL